MRDELGAFEILDNLAAEMDASRTKWGAYRSPHEAYGVLAEEMSELLAAIHGNNLAAARHEALQVAAVALRYAGEGHDGQCQKGTNR